MDDTNVTKIRNHLLPRVINMQDNYLTENLQLIGMEDKLRLIIISFHLLKV